MTTSQFLALVHDEVEEIHGGVDNFASLLRCACLLYLQRPRETPSRPRAEGFRSSRAQAHRCPR